MSLASGGFMWRQQRLNRLRLCLASMTERVPASGGGEVTVVQAGGCRAEGGEAFHAECQRTTGTEDDLAKTWHLPHVSGHWK